MASVRYIYTGNYKKARPENRTFFIEPECSYNLIDLMKNIYYNKFVTNNQINTQEIISHERSAL